MSLGFLKPLSGQGDRRLVPLSTEQILFVLAVLTLGHFAVILAKPEVGMTYAIPFFAVFIAGLVKRNLYIGIRDIVLSVTLAVAGLVIGLFSAGFVTRFVPISALSVYQLLLPAADAAETFSSWANLTLTGLLSMFSGLCTIALTLAYISYIALNEEFVFRGPLLHVVRDEFVRRFGRTIGTGLALVSMGGAFGYFHFLTSGSVFVLANLIILTTLGVIWGFIALVTESIWPTFISHVGWNALAISRAALILSATLPVAQVILT